MKIFKKIRLFSRELILELKKSSWPSKRELKESTIIVLLGILMLGVFVSMVDFSLFQIVSLLISFTGH